MCQKVLVFPDGIRSHNMPPIIGNMFVCQDCFDKHTKKQAEVCCTAQKDGRMGHYLSCPIFREGLEQGKKGGGP